MVIKHSTVHNPNEIVPSADWNADHTGTATPEPHTHTHASTTGQTTDDHHAKQHALNSAADHTGTITDAQHGVRTTANAHAHSHLSGVTSDLHHPQAHTLASHSTKAHAELTNVTSDQHHAKSHAHDGIDGSGTVAHSDTTGRTANDHHAQAHTLASHSTKAHAELTNVTSDQHHAQSHNMASHTDDYSAGEGIDISIGNVISGEDATTVNKGIAKFNTNNFSVAAGNVSLGAQGVNLNMNTHKIIGVVDPTLNQDAATKKYVDDTAGGAPVNASYLTLGLHGDLTAERVLTAGEGIDFADTGANGTLTINGEDATTVNKGIASFDTNHFVVIAGQAGLNNIVVNAINANTAHRGADGSDHSLLANKTSYWSCSGNAFSAQQPDVQDILYTPFSVVADQDGVIFNLTANLPHGAVVTGCIVYGNAAATAETWHLDRIDRADGNVAMATANIGTEDITIANATIDNENYSYVLRTSSVDTNDTIYGARIKYTTNYD